MHIATSTDRKVDMKIKFMFHRTKFNVLVYAAIATTFDHISHIPIFNDDNFTDQKENVLLVFGTMDFDLALRQNEPHALMD